MTLPKLRDSKDYVPGDGPLGQGERFFLVGEIPGDQERLMGKPFVGPAGKLLNSLLNEVGINRSECFVTNSFKCWEKSVSVFCSTVKPTAKLEDWEEKDGGWVRKEKLEEYELWKELLRREVSSSTAKVVVPLGGVALMMLLGMGQITKRRGSIYEFLDKRVIPTLHPSTVFRQPINRYVISNDLLKAQKEWAYWPPLPQRDYILNPTVDQILDYLEECRGQKRIGFDIEVIKTGESEEGLEFEINCFSVSRDPDSSMCIPLVNNRGENKWTPPFEVKIFEKLKALLEDPNVSVLIQNAMFDCFFMLKKYDILPTKVEDTMIAQAILAPELPKGLDFLTSAWTREPYYKDEGKKQMKKVLDWEGFKLYNAKDSAFLHEIFAGQEKLLLQQGNLPTYRNQMALFEAALFAGFHGVKVDREGTMNVSAELGEKVEFLERRLKDVLELEGEELEDFNWRSSKQVKDYFYRTLKLPAYKKGGSETTDETALKRLIAKGRKEAEYILELRGAEKLKSTYMDCKLERDNRYRFNVNLAGTKFGRWSTSATIFKTGGNFQNHPPEFKKYLRADKGYLLADPDFAQAENRIVAFTGGDSAQIEAFENGWSMHSLTGAVIARACSGEDYDWQRVEEEDKEKKKCPLGTGRFTWRFYGKKTNHASNYGMGGTKLGLEVGLPRNEAQNLIDQYFLSYPGVRRYQEWIKECLQNGRTITNLFGRKIPFLGRLDEKTFREAYSSFPQSSVADLVNQRGIRFLYERGGSGDIMEPAQLLGQVHDSMPFQVPLDIGWKKISEIFRTFRDNLEVELVTRNDATFTIPVDIEIGVNFGTKKAVKCDDPEDIERVYRELVS